MQSFQAALLRMNRIGKLTMDRKYRISHVTIEIRWFVILIANACPFRANVSVMW